MRFRTVEGVLAWGSSGSDSSRPPGGLKATRARPRAGGPRGGALRRRRGPSLSGAAGAPRAERPGGRWRCGGGDRGRRARRRGPETGAAGGSRLGDDSRQRGDQRRPRRGPRRRRRSGLSSFSSSLGGGVRNGPQPPRAPHAAPSV
ncbi:unnamed protein product, partial [Rangifer tarandus platyrhynchus]